MKQAEVELRQRLIEQAKLNPELEAITLADLERCARREGALRENVYAQRVSVGRMKEPTAVREMALQYRLIALVRWLRGQLLLARVRTRIGERFSTTKSESEWHATRDAAAILERTYAAHFKCVPLEVGE